MNFLAHLYLTKDQPEEVSIGNFIADAVKGRKAYLDYPEEIQLGIEIHREIDHYTDTHDIFKQGTRRLRDAYGKFAGIVMDIYYDHILAHNWSQYSDLSLPDFSQTQYQLIAKHVHHLPRKTQYWFDYMRHNDLLLAYANERDIEEVFRGMDRRTGSISGMSTAIKELRQYKTEFTQEFQTFFEDIQAHLKAKFSL